MIVPDDLKVGDKIAFITPDTGDPVDGGTVMWLGDDRLKLGKKGRLVYFDDVRYSAIVKRYPNRGTIIPLP